MGKVAPDALPVGYVDQVVRQQEFEAAYPSAQFRYHRRAWLATMIVGGLRRETPRCNDLRTVLDRMDALAKIEDARVTLAAQFPAWHVWLSDGWGWYATRRGARRRSPLTLGADDMAGLSAQLDAITDNEDPESSR